MPLKIRLHILHVFIYEMNFNLCVLLVYNDNGSVQTLCITRVISHNDEHVVENKVLSLINRFVCYFIK